MMPRDLALSALNSLDHSPGFSERFLKRAFHREPFMSERDRAFTIHLVQGVLRWRLRLDWIIKRAVHFPFGKIELRILNILRIALYQIFSMDRVPESAAVNEAVKQARAGGKGHMAGFVNGILRNICREKDHISFPDRESNQVSYLSVFHSYPIWLVEKWIRELGIDSAESLLAAGNRISDLVIRTNSIKISRQGLISRLEEEGVFASPTPYSPEGIRIKGLKGPVNSLNSFKEGLFQVQDEAAQVCSHLLFPRSGEFILDICAGLGGKSTHLAQLMGNEGRVLSIDTNHIRLVTLGQGLRRLGTDCVRPIVADACAHLSYLLRSSFDKIFIDGPCSGLGTISRHPDGKWARCEEDINRLHTLQLKILNEAVPLLKKGGKMLYATCTISKEENEDVIGDFLAQ
ncbi:MAG: 16S rRNA (cytosine(967)-C(5))-methyltransferase RsmB, partial [Thermodesulfobacteriota bacterium]|nr:16S rRNA (cytosine(967)-C(5))-methyltransferase RsmB [Thermodesulfobacteriota bacterium]